MNDARNVSRLAVIALILLAASASVSLAASYSNAVLTDNPLAYYRLDEAAGPAVTDLAGGNHGVADAGVAFGQGSLVANQPANGAVRTTGLPRIVTPGFEKAPVGATGYSVEYWMTLNAAPTGFHNIVGDGESGGDFYLMNYLTGDRRIRPHYSTGNAPVSTDSNAQLAVGQTAHVVTTYDSVAGSASIYIDGVLDKTVAVTTTPTNTDNPLYIGRDNRESGGDFTLDEVAVFARPLASTEIAGHRIGAMGVGPLPVSYWSFDESDSRTGAAFDGLGNNDGAFTGGAARTPGLIGLGAADFTNGGGQGVNVGDGGGDFSFNSGITLEALIQPNWSGNALDYDEIFRKEDGGNRILLSFQNDSFGGGAQIPVSGPVLSFGLNTGGYGELDMPLNTDLSILPGGNPASGTIYLDPPVTPIGPNDVVLKDGGAHHVVASYDQASGLKNIFIDGVLRWSFTVPGAPAILSGGGSPGYIGNLTSGVEPFNGVIDEVAIYDLALTDGRVAYHWDRVTEGSTYFAVAPVPEPATAMLLLTAAAPLIRRRR